jgi:putative transposase
MQPFKSQGSVQKFVSASAAVCNTFNLQRHLISRKTLRIFRAAANAAWMAAPLPPGFQALPVFAARLS